MQPLLVNLKTVMLTSIEQSHKQGTCCAGHSDGLETASLSADGQTLLTVAFDRSARVWDLRSGKCAAVLAPNGQVRLRGFCGDAVLAPMRSCLLCALHACTAPAWLVRAPLTLHKIHMPCRGRDAQLMISMEAALVLRTAQRERL